MLSSKSIFSLLFISWKSDNEKFVKSPLPGAKFIFLTAASCTLECHYGWFCQIWSENYKSRNRLCAPIILKLLLICTIEESQSEKPDGFGILQEFYATICFFDNFPVWKAKVEKY